MKIMKNFNTKNGIQVNELEKVNICDLKGNKEGAIIVAFVAFLGISAKAFSQVIDALRN